MDEMIKYRSMERREVKQARITSEKERRACLTSGLLVFYQDLQLQQPPGDVRVVSHHRETGLKLSFHTELHTPISCHKYALLLCYLRTHAITM